MTFVTLSHPCQARCTCVLNQGGVLTEPAGWSSIRAQKAHRGKTQYTKVSPSTHGGSERLDPACLPLPSRMGWPKSIALLDNEWVVPLVIIGGAGYKLGLLHFRTQQTIT